jgi:hypothetical protein
MNLILRISRNLSGSLGSLIIAGAVIWGPVSAADQIGSGSPRYLFLDPAIIIKSHAIDLRVNPPQRRETVIRPDRPWEQLMISFYTTVIEEQGKLRLWYICRDRDNQPNLAYAESTDGVSWEKPNLGIVDYHGSRDNNLVGITSLDGAVFRDPRARPGEEYIYVAHVAGAGVFRFFSPDGLHWQRDPRPLLPFRADTQNVVMWDEQKGRYALYLRGWDIGEVWTARLRKVVRLDLDTLSAQAGILPSGRGANPDDPKGLPRIVDEIPTVLAADEHDPRKTDVYTIAAQVYPLDPRWYLGFPSFFRRDKNISDGRLEVQFVGSRDGIHWQRYDRSPYVSPGLEDSESANMVFIGPGLVIRGAEIWQYGTGFRGRHGAVEQRKERPEGIIFRYVQRVDGFVSLDFALDGGRCRTVPVKVTGTRLLLNIDTGALGVMRVGLIGADGRSVPDFGVDQCDPLQVNSIGAMVSWSGRSDLGRFTGQELRLEFRSTRAKLYSFRFE